MTRQEQYDKLQHASKLLHDARRMIREARAGGDNVKSPFFGRIQTAHQKVGDAVEMLAETCHEVRSSYLP